MQVRDSRRPSPHASGELRERGQMPTHNLAAGNDAFGSDMRTGAIVLGGNFVGLGLVRSLGSRGIPTWVVDRDRGRSIARFSKHTKRFIAHAGDVHDLLLQEGRRHRLDGWTLFAVDDESVELLAKHHQSLSAIYRLTVPPLEVTRFALDKRLTYRRADELGIATPKTTIVDSVARCDVRVLRSIGVAEELQLDRLCRLSDEPRISQRHIANV